jgi:hypothetical protein
MNDIASKAIPIIAAEIKAQSYVPLMRAFKALSMFQPQWSQSASMDSTADGG